MVTKVDTKEAVIARILAARTQLLSLGVQNVGLFGLFARGEQTALSDADLLVEFLL